MLDFFKYFSASLFDVVSDGKSCKAPPPSQDNPGYAAMAQPNFVIPRCLGCQIQRERRPFGRSPVRERLSSDMGQEI